MSMTDHDAAQCTRLGAALAVLVAIAYYGFLLIGAYAPGLLARSAIGHVPWSFVLGAGLLIGAVAATGCYVVVANRTERRSETRA
jgi:uncharacterized membrane protein (DUF485 family)